jgi:hypothetical protein
VGDAVDAGWCMHCTAFARHNGHNIMLVNRRIAFAFLAADILSTLSDTWAVRSGWSILKKGHAVSITL